MLRAWAAALLERLAWRVLLGPRAEGELRGVLCVVLHGRDGSRWVSRSSRSVRMGRTRDGRPIVTADFGEITRGFAEDATRRLRGAANQERTEDK